MRGGKRRGGNEEIRERGEERKRREEKNERRERLEDMPEQTGEKHRCI